MRKTLLYLTASLLLTSAMWVWVQGVLIPHQRAEAAEKGIPRGNLSDLYPRWLGARELLLHGRDPYAADVTREIQAGYYGRELDAAREYDPKDQQGFVYPLYVVFLLAPTVGLPFSVVQTGFTWLLVVLTALSVLLWMRVLEWRTSATTLTVWIVLTVGSFPAIQGFKLQQLTLLVAALIAGAMYAIVTRHFVAAGILLALASIKPQLVVLIGLWLFIWCLGRWKERQSLIWSFAGSMGILLGASLWLRPGWIGEFRAASAAYYQYTGGGKSVLDVLLTPLAGRTLAVVLVIVVLIVLWRNRAVSESSAEFRWSLALVLATTLMVIPMFAPYNQLLLSAPLMLIVCRVRELSAEGQVSRFLLGFTALCVGWPWIAASLLGIALLFLPAATVQRVWFVPLYSSLMIPVAVLSLMLVGRTGLRSELEKA